MNVVSTIVSANSDATAQASRQGRDTASKDKGSGFSETLGSFDKAPPARQNAGGNANAAKDDAQPQVAEDDAAPAQTLPPAPANQAQPVVSKPVTTPALFPVATGTVTVASQDPALPIITPDMTMEAPVVAAVPATTVPVTEAGNDTALAPVMSDLAKLVTALTKAASASVTSKTDGDTTEGATDEVMTDGDAVPASPANGNMDLLALLASTAMPPQSDQAPLQNAGSTQDAKPTLGNVSGALATDPLIESGATTTSVVRLQKQDAPGIDFHFETNEDGSTKVDVAKAAGDAIDVVQVVESRRFVGLAPTTNAAAITSAMSSDPDWATSMAGQTTNGPMIASTGQVVHVLKIQMAPVDLGHVTAALKLVGDELSVQLTAHTLKGYSELQKDSSSILDALKSQGFNVEQVTVSMASGADRQDTGTNNRQPDTGQQGAQHNQRGHEEKPQQQQSYRQASGNAREEAIVNDSTSTAETSVRPTSARPDLVYL
ncbi:hypothetical protein RRU01S_10_00720 [Agrobacterium rubi TR3 = NBRC 13261]|uniref:Flagellar hook-length control protein-like C-terminal domain-containing protein n=1 Tax=Agrobacterium rubi TR3 = NBRC 13261 TaxID=1368415 RepID=A0A081CU87_9HYPH|nr:flagellar hook-length control protein FliK [Agrobacterium rubi]MBP1879085.1 chemotaxis protein MotD [Agrobacterium rubi]MCL6652405.1 hypothetical protein [Agrobacterium rubi]GAK70233.1 hypothetical protein RRU01S_10_00720 [Agrobacterium rubi TR3 = NBRC 13261]